MIINIRVDKLFPHPDNPRKDLGDLTELTDSRVKNSDMTIYQGICNDNRKNIY